MTWDVVQHLEFVCVYFMSFSFPLGCASCVHHPMVVCHGWLFMLEAGMYPLAREEMAVSHEAFVL